jgi:hypothetical protein
MSFVSAVNQPERVFVNSFDDPADSGIFALWPFANEKYFQFTCRLPTPVLAPERTQLLRATIPNINVNIPDYQLVFFYAREDVSGNLTYHNVRILPSWISPTDAWAVSTGLPINRQYANYQDFVQALNLAAAAPDDTIYNPYHIPGDVEFYYDATTRLITMEPNDIANYTYYLVGYKSPVLDALNNSVLLYNLDSGIPTIQPSIPETSLNLRIGFCQGGGNVILSPTLTVRGLVPPNSTGNRFIAPTYANLVYSQNCYILSNFVQGSGISSGGQHNVLATVPMAAPPLGVSIFNAPLVNWLTRVVKEIYEINIVLLDDNYQPFLLPNSAIVNVDLGFSYTKL